ncbi:MAG: UDP-N-acetylmuramate dehydrogenase [Thermoflexales bacterium]|nr:UDP-N-acetylmuramate dehydrogenase [Thermoflexales bacterium]
MTSATLDWADIQARARRNELLARYTTARIGGPADLLIEVRSTAELIAVAQRAVERDIPFVVIGSGANILVSDRGVRGLVILNRARSAHFEVRNARARVEVDSGVLLMTLARDCIERGIAGMEWAISVPGTVGGAVVGNAGAHGTDMAACVQMVRVLRRDGIAEYWTPRQLQFGYRTSALKRYLPHERPIVLSATLELKLDSRVNLERRANEHVAYRKATQPPGASIGSMFKNPPGDYAGRLIEACGLKGKRIGGAMISEKHANFFVNASGDAKARDVKALIDLARRAVFERFGVLLELEVELIGDWGDDQPQLQADIVEVK